MRITNLKVKAFRGFPTEFKLPFDNSGKNLLVYGENGSAKSSIARALELLFDPNPGLKAPQMTDKRLISALESLDLKNTYPFYKARLDSNEITWVVETLGHLTRNLDRATKSGLALFYTHD